MQISPPACVNLNSFFNSQFPIPNSQFPIPNSPFSILHSQEEVISNDSDDSNRCTGRIDAAGKTH
ncbi:MAG: hypothetical protein F6K41_00740 [Symploca sp. SIO3E6]|nr:hypothetical protein [Caldora sp. SIO3E6]